jgi:insertion element IS1 protein InsB
VHCPTCDGADVVKHGKTSDGKQRFRCQNPQCESVTFILTVRSFFERFRSLW